MNAAPFARPRSLFLVLLLLLLLPPAAGFTPARAADDNAQRLSDAADAYKALLAIPDSTVPERLQRDCKCVAVFPGVVKGAIGIGARRGHGVMSCRDTSGAWSAPLFLTMTGGSYGLQIGIEKTQLVLFFMTDRGARSLVQSKFTFGGNASVAAGPVGRSAEGSTDLKLNSEIYSYARSKGAFAGISLDGARVAPDKKAIRQFYGRNIPAEQLLFDHPVAEMPPAAQTFTGVLPK